MYQYAMPVQVVHARLPVFSACQQHGGSLGSAVLSSFRRLAPTYFGKPSPSHRMNIIP